jgi:hypothetical protein
MAWAAMASQAKPYGPQTDAADLDAFKERCADDRHHFRFILSPEDGAELEDLRTHAAPHGPHGGRPGHGPRLGGRQPLEHRQPAHAHRRARTRRHRQRPHHRGRLHRRWFSAIAPPNWRPNGWGRAPSWRSSRPCNARWNKSDGRAWIARSNASWATMAWCMSNASTSRDCNASACC